jgi:hypothetical protein
MALTEFLASRLGSGDHRRRGSARVRRSDLEKVEEFLAVKDQLIAEARTLPGLTASATFRSEGQDNLFIDRMRWESAEDAKAGLEAFRALPTSERFLSLMAVQAVLDVGR